MLEASFLLQAQRWIEKGFLLNDIFFTGNLIITMQLFFVAVPFSLQAILNISLQSTTVGSLFVAIYLKPFVAVPFSLHVILRRIQ